MRITVKPEIRNNAMSSVLIKPHFFLAPNITDFIRNTKREFYDEKLEDALEMLDLEWSKDDDTHQDAEQSVEHQSTSPRKCVQQEWSSTGKTTNAVGSALKPAGRC